MTTIKTIYATKDGRSFETALEADRHEFGIHVHEAFGDFKPKAALDRMINLLRDDPERASALEVALRQLRTGGGDAAE